MSDMKRREFIALLGGTAVSCAARAQQQGKIPRIGGLLPGPPTTFSLRTEAFRQGLRDLGFSM
jgi:hypothetical protein